MLHPLLLLLLLLLLFIMVLPYCIGSASLWYLGTGTWVILGNYLVIRGPQAQIHTKE